MNADMRNLKKSALDLGIDLDDRQLVLFDLYQRELLLWNTRTNLISEKTAGEIIPRHFLDSLTAVSHVAPANARMVDIGCGAGFPGIPIKIALPSIQLWLLETNRKKVSFLKHIVRLLNLQNTHALHDRTENILRTDQWREKFDIVISRASLKLPALMPLGDYFLVPGGLLITLKGTEIEDEMRQAMDAGNYLKKYKINQYDIFKPVLGPPRKIIIAQKIK